MKIHQHFAGHMTKMAAMPIYGKNTLKIFFPGTTEQILIKLCMKHQRPKPFIIPPANCVCGRVYCFHIVRPSESVAVTFCFLNILKSH